MVDTLAKCLIRAILRSHERRNCFLGESMATAAKSMTQYPGPQLMEPRAEYRTGRDVQIEDGNWFKLHNQIAEALAAADLTGVEFRLLWHILRMTYGWQRKEADISYADFARATGTDRQNARKHLLRLEENNIIVAKDNGPRSPKTYLFNKYSEHWFSASPVEPQHYTDVEPQHYTDVEPQHYTDVEPQHYTDVEPQHYTYKDIEIQVNTGGKKAPRLTPQEHTLKQATMTALNAELPAKERVPYVDPIAKYVGMSKLIESDDQALVKVHQSAVKIHGMGATVQDLRNWWNDWKRDYRSKGASLTQFEKFVSEQLEKHVPDTVVTQEEPVFMGAAAPDPWTIQ